MTERDGFLLALGLATGSFLPLYQRSQGRTEPASQAFVADRSGA